MCLLLLTGCTNSQEIRDNESKQVTGKGVVVFRITRESPHDDGYFKISEIHRFGDPVDIPEMYFNVDSPGWYYSMHKVTLAAIVEGTPAYNYRYTSRSLREPRKVDGKLVFEIPEFGTVEFPVPFSMRNEK